VVKAKQRLDPHRVRTAQVAIRRLAASRPSGTVGSFRLGTLSRHQDAATWRVAVSDRDVGIQVAALLDGQVQLATEPDLVEILTGTSDISVVLTGPDALRLDWHRSAAAAICGGTARPGRPCACPPSLGARRATARQGRACEPHAHVRFRLCDAPDLGLFRIVSGNWSFAEEAEWMARVLRERGQPVCCWLSLRRRTWTLRSG
jgi:hypothetical protein